MNEFKIPAECGKCGSLYELEEDFIEEDEYMNISKVLIEKYDYSLLYVNCCNIFGLIEEGKFRLIIGENMNNWDSKLEPISKNWGRKVWKVIHKNAYQFTFDINDFD